METIIPTISKLDLPTIPTIQSNMPTVQPIVKTVITPIQPLFNTTKKDKEYWYSDGTDNTQVTSLLDIVDKTIDPVDNGGNAFKALSLATNEWFNRHFVKPIEYKSMGMFANNMLEGFGEDMDVLANVTKALLPTEYTTGKNYSKYKMRSASSRVKAAIGYGVKGRYSFDMDTGHFVTDMLGEVAMDPLTWLELGTKAIVRSGTTAIAGTTMTMAKDVIEHSEDPIIKMFKEFNDADLDRIFRNKELSAALIHGDQNEYTKILKNLLRSTIDESDENELRKALLNELRNITDSDETLNKFAKDLFEQTGTVATHKANLELLKSVEAFGKGVEKLDDTITLIAGTPFTPVIHVLKKTEAIPKLVAKYVNTQMARTLIGLTVDKAGEHLDVKSIQDAFEKVNKTIDDIDQASSHTYTTPLQSLKNKYVIQQYTNEINSQIQEIHKLFMKDGTAEDVAEFCTKYGYTDVDDYIKSTVDAINMAKARDARELQSLIDLEQLNHSLKEITVLNTVSRVSIDELNKADEIKSTINIFQNTDEFKYINSIITCVENNNNLDKSVYITDPFTAATNISQLDPERYTGAEARYIQEIQQKAKTYLELYKLHDVEMHPEMDRNTMYSARSAFSERPKTPQLKILEEDITKAYEIIQFKQIADAIINVDYDSIYASLKIVTQSITGKHLRLFDYDNQTFVRILLYDDPNIKTYARALSRNLDALKQKANTYLKLYNEYITESTAPYILYKPVTKFAQTEDFKYKAILEHISFVQDIQKELKPLITDLRNSLSHPNELVHYLGPKLGHYREELVPRLKALIEDVAELSTRAESVKSKYDKVKRIKDFFVTSVKDTNSTLSAKTTRQQKEALQDILESLPHWDVNRTVHTTDKLTNQDSDFIISTLDLSIEDIDALNKYLPEDSVLKRFLVPNVNDAALTTGTFTGINNADNYIIYITNTLKDDLDTFIKSANLNNELANSYLNQVERLSNFLNDPNILKHTNTTENIEKIVTLIDDLTKKFDDVTKDPKFIANPEAIEKLKILRSKLNDYNESIELIKELKTYPELKSYTEDLKHTLEYIKKSKKFKSKILEQYAEYLDLYIPFEKHTIPKDVSLNTIIDEIDKLLSIRVGSGEIYGPTVVRDLPTTPNERFANLVVTRGYEIGPKEQLELAQQLTEDRNKRLAQIAAFNKAVANIKEIDEPFVYDPSYIAYPGAQPGGYPLRDKLAKVRNTLEKQQQEYVDFVADNKAYITMRVEGAARERAIINGPLSTQLKELLPTSKVDVDVNTGKPIQNTYSIIKNIIDEMPDSAYKDNFEEAIQYLQNVALSMQDHQEFIASMCAVINDPEMYTYFREAFANVHNIDNTMDAYTLTSILKASMDINAMSKHRTHRLTIDALVRKDNFVDVSNETLEQAKLFAHTDDEVEDIAKLITTCGHLDSGSDVYAQEILIRTQLDKLHSTLMAYKEAGHNVANFDIESGELKVFDAQNLAEHDLYRETVNKFNGITRQFTLKTYGDNSVPVTFCLAEEAPAIEKARLDKGIKQKANIIVCASELDLYTKLNDYLKTNNIDVLVGFNNRTFDNPFALARLNAVTPSSVSPEKYTFSELRTAINKSYDAMNILKVDNNIPYCTDVTFHNMYQVISNALYSESGLMIDDIDLNDINDCIKSLRETIHYYNNLGAFADFDGQNYDIGISDKSLDNLDVIVQKLENAFQQTSVEASFTSMKHTIYENIFEENLLERNLDGTFNADFTERLSKAYTDLGYPSNYTLEMFEHDLRNDPYTKDINQAYHNRWLYRYLGKPDETYTDFMIRITDGKPYEKQILKMDDLYRKTGYRSNINYSHYWRFKEVDKLFTGFEGEAFNETTRSNLMNFTKQIMKSFDSIKNLQGAYMVLENALGQFGANEVTVKKLLEDLIDKIVDADPTSYIKYLDIKKLDTPTLQFATYKKLLTLKDTPKHQTYQKAIAEHIAKNYDTSIKGPLHTDELLKSLNESLKMVSENRIQSTVAENMSKAYIPNIDLLPTEIFKTTEALDRWKVYESYIDTVYSGDYKTLARRQLITDLIDLARSYSAQTADAKHRYLGALNNIGAKLNDAKLIYMTSKFAKDPKELIRYLVMYQPMVHFANTSKFGTQIAEYDKLIKVLKSTEYSKTLNKFGAELVPVSDGFDIRLIKDELNKINRDSDLGKAIYLGNEYSYYTKADFADMQIVLPEIQDVPKEHIATINNLLNQLSEDDLYLYSPNKFTSNGYEWMLNNQLDTQLYGTKWFSVQDLKDMGYFDKGHNFTYNFSPDTYRFKGYYNNKNVFFNEILENYRHHIMMKDTFDLAQMMMSNTRDGMDLLSAAGHFFAGCSDEEIIKVLNADNAPVVVAEILDNSVQGKHLQAIPIMSIDDLNKARALNAKIMPYQMYSEFFQQYNLNKNALSGFPFNSNFMKAVMYSFKIGYLCSPGTWFRNIIDSNLKAMIDTKDPASLIANEAKAAMYLTKYNQALSILQKANFDKTLTNTNIAKIFSEPEYLPIRKQLDNIGMSKDMFFAIRGTCLNGAGIGEGSAMKKLIKAQSTGDTSIYDALVNAGSTLLIPMQHIESNIRFAQYLTLIEQGIGATEAFKRIANTAFDYGIKSKAAHYIEYVIPFYNFQKLNIMYWLRTLEKNPSLIRYIDDYMGAVENSYGLDPADKDEDWYQGIMYHMNSGNPAMGFDTVNSYTESSAVLKLNPSFMDLINLLLDPKEKIGESILAPYANIMGGINEYIGELWNGKDLEGADAAEHFKAISEIFVDPSNFPMIGVLAQRYFNSDSTAKKNNKRLQKPVERIVATALPDVFGSVQRWENYKIDNTQLNNPTYYSSYTYRQQAMPQHHANYYRQYYRRYYPEHSRAYWYAIRLNNTDTRYRSKVVY